MMRKRVRERKKSEQKKESEKKRESEENERKTKSKVPPLSLRKRAMTSSLSQNLFCHLQANGK